MVGRCGLFKNALHRKRGWQRIMEQQILVGSTGFVGANLLAKRPFDKALHSTDIAEAFGGNNGLVVYAGVPAAMFLANSDPAADLAVMQAARENLRRINAKKTVLISSIAVYADSRGKTEADDPAGEGLAPYGANRLQLEKWVREDHPDALIVRLPALYGIHLKKNFLYDLHTITPAMLREEKYRELAARCELVEKGYSPAENGFYKLNGSVSGAALREWFAAQSFNALAFTDSRSRYQFYDLGRLWEDIEACLQNDLRLVNLTTPPVSAAKVYTALTGKIWKNELDRAPFDYDLRSLYAGQLGGQGGYLCSEEDELRDIRTFMEEWT